MAYYLVTVYDNDIVKQDDFVVKEDNFHAAAQVADKAVPSGLSFKVEDFKYSKHGALDMYRTLNF